MLLSYLVGLAACALTASAAHDAPQCGPKVVSLATGIRMNIVGQMAELNATEALLKIEASKFTVEQFAVGKGKLLADIAAGINIRKYNLAIAPKDNPALPGLHKYAAAQGAEQKLAQELKGVVKKDKPKLEKLKSDIMAGTKLNMNNLKLATSKNNCSLGFDFPPYP